MRRRRKNFIDGRWECGGKNWARGMRPRPIPPFDLLKSWGTGHPGGLATLHASSARGALTRLEQLIQEVVVTVPRALIAEAVDIVVFIGGRGRSRRVEEIVRVIGLDADGYRLEPLSLANGATP